MNDQVLKDLPTSGKIRVTPLYGGRSNTAASSILHLSDSCRLLLDCGLSFPIPYEEIENIAKELVAQGGVNAILLSHGDLSHVGALPIISGVNGLSNVPIICTLPVHKYSQLVLYDFVINQEMEGEGTEFRRYTLDDVDHAFKKVTTLKFSQIYSLPLNTTPTNSSLPQHPVTIEALPSGRTLGGTMWKIRCGPAEILYAMDINLRKEILLDAPPLDLLPTSPALMICDVHAASRGSSTKKKKDKDDTTAMINSILETVREGGNVLIPCETAGRLLELLLVLNKYWVENRLGLYHLVLLSHMANNILEFARYQLEWMSDTVTKGFYNGKSNPFDLSAVKCFQDIRHMEKQCYGPKVVIATDQSLSFGLSKELLLKWGGDVRCRVIFIDQDRPLDSTATASSTYATLAEELKARSLQPPIICSVNIPIRIPLQGQELETYREQQLVRKQQLEEEIFQRRRKDEISKFALIKDIKEIVEEEEDEATEIETVISSMEDATSSSGGGPVKKKQKTEAADIGPAEHRITSQTVIPSLPSTTNPTTATTTAPSVATSTTTTANLEDEGGPEGNYFFNNNNQFEVQNVEEELQRELEQLLLMIQETPTKLVARSQTVQFTCDFKTFNFTGTVNFKAMRDVIHHINPKRLLLLSGLPQDFQQFSDYYSQLANEAQSNSSSSASAAAMEVFQPANNESIEFEVFTQSLKVQILKRLVPKMIKVVQTTTSSSTTTGTASHEEANASGSGSSHTTAFCTIGLLKGYLSTNETITSDGVRLIRYLGESAPATTNTNNTNTANATTAVTTETKMEVEEEAIAPQEEEEDEEEDAAPLIIPSKVQPENHTQQSEEEALELPEEESHGVVSFREITLTHLKQQLDALGVKTEFHFTASGGILVCNDQVMIRTDGQHRFYLEGPPIKAYFDARKILYQQVAFI